MITMTKTGQFGVSEYVADNYATDKTNLPADAAVGSAIYDIATGNVYMKNANSQWICITDRTQNGGNS